MNRFRRLIARRGTAFPLILALVTAACSSSQDETSSTEAEALTCPSGYHLACNGTRTPTGQCIGVNMCQDANGNWSVGKGNPVCGQIGQTCCASPIDGPTCNTGYCSGGFEGTCIECGLLGQVSCGGRCNPAAGVYPDSNGICVDCTVPNTYLDNSWTCQSCAGLTFGTPTPKFPQYWPSTLTPPPAGVSILTSTGPQTNGMQWIYPQGYTAPYVYLQAADGTVVSTANAQLSVFGAPPQTYTEVMRYGTCAVPAPTTITMPLGDAVGIVTGGRYQCQYPVQVGNNGGGSMQGPVTIIPILWGWGSPGPQGYGAQLDAIYQQIAQSQYYAWIREEYGAPEIKTVPTIFTQAPFPAHLSKDIYKHDLEADLNAMVYSNVVPEPDNAVYAIHLGKGVSTYSDSAHTNYLCHDWIGYNLKTAFTNVLYGWGRHYILIADPSTCPGSNMDVVTTTISHELIEELTDPDVGDGWRDQTQPASCGNQVGDLCSNLAQLIRTPVVNPVTGSQNVVVQKIWSMKMGACVTENALNVPLE